MVALLAFVLGGGLAGWLVWSGELAAILPQRSAADYAPQLAAGPAGSPRAAANGAAGMTEAQTASAVGSVETRLALLEDRFSRIDLAAAAASGNAGRAEALLVALAARRRIERGVPLGYVEDQLKLRFAGAQASAVQTIISAARTPVTLGELSGGLDTLAPELTGTPPGESGWTRARRELSNLFVIRRAAAPATPPQDRVARARLMLASGRIDEAIAEVERLRGGTGAQEWIASARRYDAVQRALDVIETTAMLEPRRLQDGTGHAVNQPSPLAEPAPLATAMPVPAAP
jgi:hypothetical protein